MAPKGVSATTRAANAKPFKAPTVAMAVSIPLWTFGGTVPCADAGLVEKGTDKATVSRKSEPYFLICFLMIRIPIEVEVTVGKKAK
jgi:hypothetical protein